MRNGYREDGEKPDLVVLNTCAVTARAEAKGRKLLREYRRRFPEAELAIVGCGLTYSKLQDRDLRELVPKEKRSSLPRFKEEGGGITFFSGHSRAFVKVQDGCDSFCSYCVIPIVRSVLKSRPPREVVEEIGGLLEKGYREIVLTGINLGKYGADFSAPFGLVELIELVLGIKGEFRVRLSSIEPQEITDRLIGLLAGEERICPHLHIPLQSGSDAILKKMNRTYGYSDYRALVERIREGRPDLAVTTDIIVGFPGETERDFLASRRALEEVGFGKVHIFPYSRREGTESARSPQLPRETVRKRAADLKTISDRVGRAWRERFLGREVEVIVEKVLGGGKSLGIDEHYLKVVVVGSKLLPGSLYRVKIEGLEGDGCRGKAI